MPYIKYRNPLGTKPRLELTAIDRNHRGFMSNPVYMHMRGIIHQDIKPANIMIGEYGEVLIVDWGVARVLSLYEDNPKWIRIKASESFLRFKRDAISGTARYMAPEQLENHPDEIDSRVDVYALGIIMFYILSKSKPFSTADSNIATLLDLKRKETPSLEEWTRNNTDAVPIPKALIDICDKAIAHTPKSDLKTPNLCKMPCRHGSMVKNKKTKRMRSLMRSMT